MPTECAASFDNLRVVAKAYLVERQCALDPLRLAERATPSEQQWTANRADVSRAQACQPYVGTRPYHQYRQHTHTVTTAAAVAHPAT